MAKFSFLVLVAFGLAIGLLGADEATVSTDEPQDAQVKEPNDEETGMDRSGFYSRATATSYTSTGGRSRTYPTYPHSLVECYACTDCPHVLPNTTTKMCPRTLDPYKQSSCVVYVEQYKHLKKDWYIRGCATERGSCADIRVAHAGHSEIVRLLSCDECEGDRCNTSGTTRSLSSFTIALITLALPLITKCVMS